LAHVVARNLAELVSAQIEVCATDLEVEPSSPRIWNGWIAGEHMSGGAKLRAVRKLAARCGLDLGRSYAYGDSAGDLQMLEGIGCGVAVNPSRSLAGVARSRGWQTYVWKRTRGKIPDLAARRLASTAAR